MPPKGVPGWARQRWSGMHAEPTVALTARVTDGFRYVPAEPVEGEVEHPLTIPLPSPLPAKMAYEILEGECEAMREALAHMSVVLEVMEQTLRDAQTRVTPIY